MDQDDEFDHVPPYDADAEAKPDSVVYQPIFKSLQTEARRAIYLLRDVLVSSKYQNAMTLSLREEVKSRLKDDVAEQTMFAFSGDMAAGKSSVINSILNTGTIARKGASGASCTWVVQRFLKKFPGQQKAYAAKVSFFNNDQIENLIASMLEKYVQASVKDSEDEDTDTEAMESQNYNDRHTVLEGFSALFRDREEFGSLDAAISYLLKVGTDDDLGILAELQTWACQVASDFLEGKQQVSIDASSADELLQLLQPYTYELIGDEGGLISPWPLVSVVDFGLDVPILNQGIVLVDAPGLSDSNSTRSKNSREYHRQCTHKITVADISRALNNMTLREDLKKSHRYRGSGGTLLVLTRSDTIDAETEVAARGVEKKKEQTLKNELAVLREEKNKLNQKKRRLPRGDQFEVDDQIREKNISMAAKAQELDACRILMRNKTVIRGVQELYRGLTTDAKPLSAFAIGNEDYKIHQAGYDIEDKPTLTVEETGIPALRHRIFELPAEGKLSDELHFVSTHVPNLVTFFDLYCSKTHLARKSEIETLIQAPIEKLPPILSSMQQAFKKMVDEVILQRMEEHESEWVEGAEKLSKGWARAYPKDNLPIFRNKGYKKGTKGAADVRFTTALANIKSPKEALNGSFKEIQDKFKMEIYGKTTTEFTHMLDSVKKALEENQEYKMLSDTEFLKSFAYEKQQIRELASKLCREARNKASGIWQTVDSPEASYFDEAMEPIYNAIIEIKGQGGPKGRLVKFQQEVTAMNGVWMKVHGKIELAFLDLARDHVKKMEQGMKEAISSIHRKFKLMCEETAVTDEGEKKLEEELRAKLRDQLVKAKELMNGPIKDLAEQCKNYGSGAGKEETLVKSE